MSALDTKTGDDAVKKAQLAKSVYAKCLGQVMVQDKALVAEARIKECIADSLQNYFATIKSLYAGRFPTVVRAAYQSVMVAVAGHAPPKMLTGIASFLGLQRMHMNWARDRWQAYLDGEEESTFEERYKASNAREPEYTQFIVNDCWLHDEFTRESERAKDKLRNPYDHGDSELQTIR